ncbi:hypothetical protein HCQ94_04850 [Actinomyces sp. zg-332]|uniref:FtsK/SpoIIIE domain-containing protein n=1 Tax=Actinomyces sp. zg-332 TaxID=2708340 RepID=UPI0014225504|nr:FtsK/SpoIIIE domain-containing protein [Actinomyces sp. zg-332]QPK93909.1 hypothetical protein HCQ94_04850 [Actinomyces sp. zg-332]
MNKRTEYIQQESYHFRYKVSKVLAKNKTYIFRPNEHVLFKGKYAKEYLYYISLQAKSFYNLNYRLDNNKVVFYHGINEKDNKNTLKMVATTSIHDNSNFYPSKIIDCKYPIKLYNSSWGKFLFENGIETPLKSENLPKIAKIENYLKTDEKTIFTNWITHKKDFKIPAYIYEDNVKNILLNNTSPHCLISGNTGSGKSESLVTIILSIAINYSPQYVKLLLIDYKGGLSFNCVKTLPHIDGIYTDLDQSITLRAIKSLKSEIQKREKLLLIKNAKDIDEYNANSNFVLPRLLIIIDEFLSLSNEKYEVIDSLINLVTKGRALGIHLILATQNSANTIPNTIKSNIDLQIYMQKNEYETNSYLTSFEEKIPGRALVNKNIVQFLWAGKSEEKFVQNTLQTLVQIYEKFKETNPYTGYSPIIIDSLPEKIYITTNNILYTDAKKIIKGGNKLYTHTICDFSKEITLGEKVTVGEEITLGMAESHEYNKQYIYTISKGSHNFQIPNYSIFEYIQTIIFNLAKTNLTLVITSNDKLYENRLKSYNTNIAYITYKNPNHILSVLSKYLSTNIKINLLVEDWEYFIEQTTQTNIKVQHDITTQLFNKAKTSKMLLIIFSHKPIKDCQFHYHFDVDTHDIFLWKNNIANDKNKHKNTLGRIFTYDNRKTVEIQLPVLSGRIGEIENTLKITNKNTYKYIFPLPKLFIYNYENYCIETKERCDKSLEETFILGLEEATLKEVKLKYENNYIVFTDSDYEKYLFLKTLFKSNSNAIIPQNINSIFGVKEYYFKESQETDMNSINEVFSNKIFLLKIRTQSSIVLNVDNSFSIDSVCMTAVLSHKISIIVFVNKNNYVFTQSLLYKTIDIYTYKILFTPERKNLDLLGISRQTDNIIFDENRKGMVILMMNENEHKWIQLAQLY